MLTVLAAMLLQMACSSSKQVPPTADRKEIKGSWLLNTISYDGLEAGAKYNIALLDEGPAECLKGSTWILPNNGFGSYSLISTAAGCTPGERKINWSYRTDNGETIFQYKVLEEGVKAKKVTEGYRFKIVSADENNMHLQQETAADGKMVYINYQFTSIK
jgi:hypothetical protein